MSDFESELADLLNRFSLEGGSNTPDFILADYLRGCLENWDRVIKRRENWWGFQANGSPCEKPSIGGPGSVDPPVEIG